MNVLSLFDGISCAKVALEKANIKVGRYYASEIDKNAIKVSKSNHPEIIQIGDIKYINHVYDTIDLLIGGSPCQDLSIAKKDRKGLEGDRSGLFWEYVRIKNEVNPKYFILENVASMPQKDKDIITETLGVEPVMFNASLVSAQCRKRYFWTNIKFELPEDKGILLKDILQPDAEVDDRFVVNGKAFCLTSSYSKVSASPAQIEHNAKKKQRTMVGMLGNNSQANRIYDTEGKSVCLSANGGGLGAKTGLYAIGRDVGRRLNDEGHREDDNKELPITRRIELRTDDKVGTITSVQKDNLVVSETKIRKLTPIECERLQGLPDDYTKDIAMTNRYKCLGNAFNTDVVAHILSNIEVV
jgi:DNA (cytosine-5)-methyltransferase 3A